MILPTPRKPNRREMLRGVASTGLAVGLGGWAMTQTGCLPPAGPSDGLVRIFGEMGDNDGQFRKPRAIQISPANELYIVDFNGRIQVFNPAGTFLRGWRTPEVYFGKPCGLGWSNDGLLMVADTHYFRVLFYQPDGELVEARTIGGKNGSGPGEFAFLTDAVQDTRGRYFVGEYGENDRVQIFDPNGQYVAEFGGHGNEPEQFLRPQALTFDRAGRLWIADACNHRLKIYDITADQPKLVDILGHEGSAAGSFVIPMASILMTRDDSTWPSLVTIGFSARSDRKATCELGGTGYVTGRTVSALGTRSRSGGPHPYSG